MDEFELAESASVSTSENEPNPLPFVHEQHMDKCRTKLAELRASGQLTDVILVADDGTIVVAHRLVLAATSDYFCAMFTGGMLESGQHRIPIGDVAADVLSSLVDYCYSGSVEMSRDNVTRLLSGARLLQLERVVQACCAFLSSELEPANCLGIHDFAQLHGCQALGAEANNYAADHFGDVVQQQEFVGLSEDAVVGLLDSDDLNVASETEVYEAARLWIEADVYARGPSAARLLAAVRLPLLPREAIAAAMDGADAFGQSVDCQALFVEALRWLLLPDHGAQPHFRTHRRMSTVGRVFAVGGVGAQNIESYEYRRDRWHQVAELGVKRLQCGVAVLDDRLYVVGGRAGLNTLKTFECWHPRSRQWEALPSMSTPRHGLGVAVLGGALYAAGGHDGWAYLSTVERWDAQTKTWQSVSNMWCARNTAAVAVLGDRLYAVGGRDSWRVLATAECYDPHTNKWTAVPPLIQARSSLGLAALGGCLYAIGGIDMPGSHPGSTRLASVERFDPRQGQWAPAAALSTARDGVAVVAVDERHLLSVGGYDGQAYLAVVERYDRHADEWTAVGTTPRRPTRSLVQMSSMCTGRAGCCVVVVPPTLPRSLV